MERVWRWRVAIMLSGVGLLAGLLRFVNLSTPRALVFDEVYYVRGAFSLLQLGYEGDWTKDEGEFATGDYGGLETEGDFVVHPMLGKLLIAAGMQLFGTNPFGWRFATALMGTLACIIVALLARHLFRSTLWGGVAGLLLAIDGMSIALSRTALLDNFLAFFAVATLGLVVADRARTRRRLFAVADAARTSRGLDPWDRLPGWGASVGPRWWRYGAMVAAGCAVSVKWSGIYFAIAFMALSVLFDVVDRRAAGYERWFLGASVRAIPTAIGTIVVMVAVYVATWWPWIATRGSWARDWAETHPGEGVMWLPESLRSLWYYHHKMWEFHTGLTSEHNYMSSPYGWLLQLRPTAFYFRDAEGADCGAERCVSAVTALGHPVIWWAGTAALIYALWRVIRHLDLVALTVSLGVLAGWVVWFPYAYRTIFTFYAVALAPFLVLTLTWALTRIARRGANHGYGGTGDGNYADDGRRHGSIGYWSRGGTVAVVAFVGVCLVVAGFFLPLWTGMPIPFEYWQIHMWLPTIGVGEGPKVGWV